jgi:hypothetical protein
MSHNNEWILGFGCKDYELAATTKIVDNILFCP